MGAEEPAPLLPCTLAPQLLFRELLARVHALLRRRALNGGNGHASADRIVIGDIVLDRATRLFDRNCSLCYTLNRIASGKSLREGVWDALGKRLEAEAQRCPVVQLAIVLFPRKTPVPPPCLG